MLAEDSLDLAEFQRLSEAARSAPLQESIELRGKALALWRGQPLADVELEGRDRNSLARLAELRLTTQIEQIDAELELGEHAKLVGELETLTAANQYQERLAAQLMLALYRSGRQAEALEVYRGVRRRLDEELGLKPGQGLRDLEAAILRQDEALDAPASIESSEAVVDAPAGAGERRRRLPLLGLGALIVLAALAIAGAVVLLRDEDTATTVEPNFVAVIDPDTNRVTSTVQVGIRPGPVAEGGGSIWVGNLDGKSLTRIDPATREVKQTIPLPATPDAIAVGAGGVWVVNGRLGTLFHVDPEFGVVSKPIVVAGRSITFPTGGVDVARGSIWAVFGDSTLVRVNPARIEDVGTSVAGAGPTALVVGYGSVRVATSGRSEVQQFSPRTFEQGPIDEVRVGRRPMGLAVGESAIWITSAEDDFVTRLDAGLSLGPAVPIPVGDGPTAVAVGDGAVWVTNTNDGTVSRIDPESNTVAETISVGNAPAGVAVAGDSVWVAVQAP